MCVFVRRFTRSAIVERGLLGLNANVTFPKSSLSEKKSQGFVDGAVTELKFYLADVEALLLLWW
jgi:hypothetical protein